MRRQPNEEVKEEGGEGPAMLVIHARLRFHSREWEGAQHGWEMGEWASGQWGLS